MTSDIRETIREAEREVRNETGALPPGLAGDENDIYELLCRVIISGSANYADLYLFSGDEGSCSPAEIQFASRVYDLVTSTGRGLRDRAGIAPYETWGDAREHYAALRREALERHHGEERVSAARTRAAETRNAANMAAFMAELGLSPGE